MLTFDEAACRVFGRKRIGEDHTPEEVEALMQLQHGFMGDIETSWVNDVLYDLANSIAAEIAKTTDNSLEFAPTIFRNALSMGVAIGVMMERGE